VSEHARVEIARKTRIEAKRPSPTILLIDDEPSLLAGLKFRLEADGHRVATAPDGHTALAALEKICPDLIISDIRMPGMDGFEVCQRLKADARWRHIPVILLTALGSREALVRGLDSGADDFLRKPVEALELRARVRSMLRIKKQFDELEAALRLREDLADMVVHDMRSPLTAIIGFSQLLLAGSLTTSESLKYVDTIRRQAQRLNSFINDLLMLAKMEQGKPLLNRSAVDINQLVLKVEENHRVITQSREINLLVELPEESRQVSLDANLFERVLDNLISNALKYSPPKSTVTLRLEFPRSKTDEALPHDPGVRIYVLDQGPGIPEEYRSRIFDKFEIVAMKRKDTPQVGLGLAFCKMVVEAHGGRIFVDANEPTGAVFTVEIQD
jgi:two-component system sensor histidine kinase/response regulator